MSVRLDGGLIRLEGACPVEDAEPLLVLLQEQPDRIVDFSACTRAHGSLIQVVLATGAALKMPHPAGFLGDKVLPALAKSEHGRPTIGRSSDDL